MYKEILKIVPQLEQSDLNKMERNLQRRFTRIAKRFGKGIGNLFKGGGLVALGLAFMDKILNPLKQVTEAIDRTLNKNDDLVTFASQFNTDPGKFAKLVTFAAGSGIEQRELIQMMTKFQTFLAEQRNGNDVGLGQFTDIKDTSDAFFTFIQSLQAMEAGQRSLVQKRIFGEDQVVKMADFVQQDFERRYKEMGLDKIDTSQLSSATIKLGQIADLDAGLKATTQLRDTIDKARVINESIVKEQDRLQQAKLRRENQAIQNYKNLIAITQTTEKMFTLLESGISQLGGLINTMTSGMNKLIGYAEKMSKARIFKSWFGGGD